LKFFGWQLLGLITGVIFLNQHWLDSYSPVYVWGGGICDFVGNYWSSSNDLKDDIVEN
jgi:hypothetical protein